MATLYGRNVTKRDNRTIPDLIDMGEVIGVVHCGYDDYTLTADLASGDIIKMMKLPPKARVIGAVLDFTDLDASGGTLNVGWAANGVDSADATGLFSATDITAAGTVIMPGDSDHVNGQFKQFSVETQIQIATSGDTDAATGTIKLAVYYLID